MQAFLVVGWSRWMERNFWMLAMKSKNRKNLWRSWKFIVRAVLLKCSKFIREPERSNPMRVFQNSNQFEFTARGNVKINSPQSFTSYFLHFHFNFKKIPQICNRIISHFFPLITILICCQLTKDYFPRSCVHLILTEWNKKVDAEATE